MSKTSPPVVRIKTELQALKDQLAVERGKLAKNGEEAFSVSEIMAQFTDLKIKMELALQAYTSSQVSLDKSRIEAYRQMKFLIVVESATLPQDNKYPDVIYNITLFFMLAGMLFAIGRIIVLTIKELK
jgi:capsular polysaccharide transport system permease protein